MMVASAIKYQNLQMAWKLWIKLPQQVIRKKLQNDLDYLTSWAQKWQMNFNIGKCKVNVRYNNDHAIYSVNSVQLSKVDKEKTKDLGVIISNDLKPNL